MTDKPTDVDLLVAKMTAMEIMLLTLVRPLAQNPKFWNDVEAISQAFQSGNQEALAQFPHRVNAIRGYLDEWRRALTPPAN